MPGPSSESMPLLPSAHQKNSSIHLILTVPGIIFAYLTWVFAPLMRLFSKPTSSPILPTFVSSTPLASKTPSSRVTLASRSEKSTTQAILPQDSMLVVIARSELPSTTYPTSALKKAPSCDSMVPMKELRSVRFSAIIDIHEFSRLAGEPVGMVPTSKAPGVKIPQIENEMRYGNRERARVVLELEPAPMKSSYNRKLDDQNDYYSESRYGSPIY